MHERKSLVGEQELRVLEVVKTLPKTRRLWMVEADKPVGIEEMGLLLGYVIQALEGEMDEDDVVHAVAKLRVEGYLPPRT